MHANLQNKLGPQTHPLFGDVSGIAREKLFRNAVTHSVTAGTVLFEQGETPNFQHVVISGSVHLFGRTKTRKEVLIETVLPPELIIPAAVLTGSPYLMQARVPERSQLLLIHAGKFRALVRDEPELAGIAIASLSRQFRRFVRQIKNLKLRPASQRVGCYLLALSARQGTPGRVVLPYEKKLIASELGLARESFSRALGALQKDDIVVEGDVITIRNPERLATSCCADPLIDGPEGERQAEFESGTQADIPASRARIDGRKRSTSYRQRGNDANA